MSTSELPLFDRELAGEARDAAIARAEANAYRTWVAVAEHAIRWVAYRYSDFTTDEVEQRILQLGAETHEKRALGALMRNAAKAGLIIGTDRYVASDMVANHRRPKRVWHSLIGIWSGGAAD